MTLIYFFLILGITVTIHEFGHFLFAKRAGIYCYEFSIGMGPIIKQWRRKNDETVYSIRLLPIGGYVSMAGEQLDEDDKVPKKQRLQNKTWLQRFSTIIAGIVFNFILAIVIFFVIGLLNGVPSSYMHITSIEDGLPAASTKLAVDDVIKKVNGKTTNADLLMLELTMNEGKEITLTVEKPDGRKIDVDIKPKKQEDGTFRYGFGLGSDVKKGLFAAVGYGFTKTWSLIVQMANSIF